MDLYKELSLTPVQFEPDVWVSRLVIFERIAPDPVSIRDIPLTRGINIVWAEEIDDDDPAAEITGHSAGKTTFCRLLRYALGEKTFGTKENMELIRTSFPEGYIAAEVRVAGQKWAVRRPFGSGRMSYVKQNATVEQLLHERGESVTQDDYAKTIGLDQLLDEFETGAFVRTSEAIQWGHILAWCSRDQEARFQSIYHWRSHRSQSEAPSFRYAKDGNLFVMRTALGLFYPDELKGEEQLAQLQQESDRLDKEIEEKRREPQFRVNLYDHELRRRLNSMLPYDHDIDAMPLRSENLLPDLHALTEKARIESELAIRRHEVEIADLQNRIDEVGGQIRKRQKDLEELDTLFQLNTAAGKELDGGVSDRQSKRVELNEHADIQCPFGDVLIRDCSYVVNRQKILQITQFQDVRAMEDAETRRRNEVEKIEMAKQDLRDAIESLENERRQLQATRNTLGIERRKQSEEARDLGQTLAALEKWTQSSKQDSGYPELTLLRERLDGINRECERLEEDLTGLLHQHDRNRQQLASIFSAAVRAVLSSGSYDGKVVLDNRELAFRITHGPAMSGEAIETLSVLLSDVASLVYNTVSDKAHLPGLVLHDSPREADLGIRIYRSFIRFVGSLVDSFGENDNCPFQYILTTTTPPPEELQAPQFVKLRLNASKVDGLLLCRNVAEPQGNGATLFDPAT